MTSKSNRFISRRRTSWDLLPVRMQSEDFMKPDTVDYESCANDFESFIFLQNKELARLTSEKKLRWYIS